MTDVYVSLTDVLDPEFAINTLDEMQDIYDDDRDLFEQSGMDFEGWLSTYNKVEMPDEILGTNEQQDYVRSVLVQTDC